MVIFPLEVLYTNPDNNQNEKKNNKAKNIFYLK